MSTPLEVWWGGMHPLHPPCVRAWAPHNCDWTVTLHVITNKYLEQLCPVICLRGGERGTCLGPPLFGGPPRGVSRVNLPYFLAKKLIIHSYNILQSRTQENLLLSKGPPTETVMFRCFAFKGAPTETALKVICFQRGPQQLLKCVSTLLLKFIEGAPKPTVVCKCSAFKGPQQQL